MVDGRGVNVMRPVRAGSVGAGEGLMMATRGIDATGWGQLLQSCYRQRVGSKDGRNVEEPGRGTMAGPQSPSSISVGHEGRGRDAGLELGVGRESGLVQCCAWWAAWVPWDCIEFSLVDLSMRRLLTLVPLFCPSRSPKVTLIVLSAFWPGQSSLWSPLLPPSAVGKRPFRVEHRLDDCFCLPPFRPLCRPGRLSTYQ